MQKECNLFSSSDLLSLDDSQRCKSNKLTSLLLTKNISCWELVIFDIKLNLISNIIKNSDIIWNLKKLKKAYHSYLEKLFQFKLDQNLIKKKECNSRCFVRLLWFIFTYYLIIMHMQQIFCTVWNCFIIFKWNHFFLLCYKCDVFSFSLFIFICFYF